jgi:hypothetical protein
MINRLRMYVLSLLITVKEGLSIKYNYGIFRYLLLCVQGRRICIECCGTGVKIKRGDELDCPLCGRRTYIRRR